MNPAHYDYETLADLAEGLLEENRAASVNAHLDTCAECRERSADLADVSRILAEAPVPSMPAELASRIDSAIAAESLSSATVVSLESRRGRRHWRILSAAAATVIVLGGGGLVANMAMNGSEGHEGAAQSPVSDPQVRRDSGGTLQSQGQKAAPEAPAGAAAGYPISQSGTDYRAATLDVQVKGVLDRGRRSTLAAPDQRLVGCVTGIVNGKTPTLVDSAAFEGKPATVIAAPGTAPGSLNIWVVGPDCTAQDPHLLRQTTTTSG